jgi:hypothetical protein
MSQTKTTLIVEERTVEHHTCLKEMASYSEQCLPISELGEKPNR